MNPPHIDLSDLVSYTGPTELAGEDAEETVALHDLVERAEDFALSMQFCDALKGKWYAFGMAPIFAVFLFYADNTEGENEIDDWFWVIVGDIPGGIVLSGFADNPEDALRVYIGQHRDWVEAVNIGEPVDNLVPVNIPATREWAEQLEAGLDRLEGTLEENFGEEE